MKGKKFQFFLFILFSLAFLGLFVPHIVSGAKSIYLAKKAASCNETYKNNVIIIKDSSFEPNYLEANLCDQVTFINKGSKPYRVAFGEHNNHFRYPGFVEKKIDIDEEIRLVLTLKGSYEFHNHLKEEAKGTLNIK